MLFPRRRWAIRIIEKAGFRIQSREASVLIELIIWASKQNQRMMERSIGQSLPVRDGVLVAAMAMENNQSAVVRVAEELAVHPVAAEKALAQLATAARDVAIENGLSKLIEITGRRQRQ
jgi:hypothetical protein